MRGPWASPGDPRIGEAAAEAAFSAPRRTVTYSFGSEELTAAYEPHEFAAMEELRAAYETAETDEDRQAAYNSMRTLHELKARLDGRLEPGEPEPELEPEQLPLASVSVEEAAAARDEAMGQVERAADEEWKEFALAAVRRTCLALETFISDDVWETGGLAHTREDRALGPVFREAQRRGWCEKTMEMRPSVRSHLSGKPVWRSLIYP